MPVLISMSIAVLIWSLYPLAASIGLQTMTSLEMILTVYFSSGTGALLMGGYYLWKSGLLKQSLDIRRELPKQAYMSIIVSGVAGVLCHGFFIVSLSMANKGGVSLLYESWPVIAVVATPFLMKKTWKEVSLKEFMISLIALAGVAIIILSDDEVDFNFMGTKNPNEAIDYTVIGGYILAFAGGYMCAILVVTKGVFSEHFGSLNDTFGASMISEIFSRLISMFLMFIAFLYFGQDLNFANINWMASFYVGFVVFVVGGALYTFALLNTDRPTIHILYYLVPVFAVIWLWIAGEASINAGIFIGGGIILIANVYLVIAGRKASFEEKL